MPTHPEIDSGIKLADNSVLIANSITTSFTSAGIYCSCGRNEVTESEFDYTGELNRKISEKIGDCEKLGNDTLITRYQGVIHLGEEQTDVSGNTTQNIYNYTPASKEGIVEYSGAITSKVVPDTVTATRDGDGNVNSATYTLGDKKYKLDVTWDGEDRINTVTRTEIEGG